MAEIVSFREGSAQFATGDGAFTTMLYVRNITVDAQRQTTRYRPPFSLTHVHVSYQLTPATFSMGMSDGSDAQKLKTMFAAATPGTVHMHVGGIVPPNAASAGIYLYSGTIEAGNFQGQDGNAEQSFTVNGWAETWSAY